MPDGHVALTESQCEALCELGSRGAGGNFDQRAMGKLFELGLVEVDANRRLVLTESGRRAYQRLIAGK
ncbi:MAG: hypothetical protein HY290_00710 [Planctomycetia bacterium]|nr:hypothetical protein [Planctomycetia bacterium]